MVGGGGYLPSQVRGGVSTLRSQVWMGGGTYLPRSGGGGTYSGLDGGGVPT